ncbi:MAG TPA: TSCPD domain-containing protein, partial [Clostridia bacterium]|nr:TSCPD domain-containing protein [Clostridia bacterium]
RLTKGRPIDEVIEILKGIRCRNNTSCPDQLTKALLEYREKNPKPGEKL